MTAEKRLEIIVRIVNLLGYEIEKNGGRYDGRMAPNLTSITDAATIEGEALDGIEDSLLKLEVERGMLSRYNPGGVH